MAHRYLIEIHPFHNVEEIYRLKKIYRAKYGNASENFYLVINFSAILEI